MWEVWFQSPRSIAVHWPAWPGDDDSVEDKMKHLLCDRHFEYLMFHSHANSWKQGIIVITPNLHEDTKGKLLAQGRSARKGGPWAQGHVPLTPAPTTVPPSPSLIHPRAMPTSTHCCVSGCAGHWGLRGDEVTAPPRRPAEAGENTNHTGI